MTRREPDRSVSVYGGFVDLFRRRRDGYTPVEFYVSQWRPSQDGKGVEFRWFMTDEERQRFANTFWSASEQKEDA